MPSFLVRNWHLKLLSLAVAAGLWLFVAVGERSQLALAAPVEYVGLPDDAVLLPDPRDRVELQVEVGRWAVSRLTSESLRVRVNVAHLPEGESQLTLAPSDVQTPPGVRVTRITPPQLRVAVAKAAEKTMRAVASVRGQPAPGYAVTRVLVDPGSVLVKGPRSTIETRESVETAPVDVAGSRATVTQTVGLVLPDNVYPIRAGRVQVTVEIRPETAVQRGGKP